jgi:hypothetical protein
LLLENDAEMRIALVKPARPGKSGASSSTIPDWVVHNSSIMGCYSCENFENENSPRKAVVYHSYGTPDVLKIEELEKPTPKDDEVLVKVCASSANPVEWYTMTGLFLAHIGNALFRPKDTRLGTDYTGVIEAVGKNVTDFKPGDEVFGGRAEAFAEYVCVSKAIALKPTNITFEPAGGVAIAALAALQGLRDYGQCYRNPRIRRAVIYCQPLARNNVWNRSLASAKVIGRERA